MNSKLFSGVAGVVVALASVSAVSANELMVQGGSSTGGNATTIVGRPGELLRFSVASTFNSVAEVYAGPAAGNSLFASRSIRDLATAPAGLLAPLVRYDVVKLPGGETRVFLGVANASPVFNGGKVRVVTGGTVIDSDPVVVK